MELGFPLLKLIAALAVVLGIFFAVIYGLKRWGGIARRYSSQPLMEILSKQSFGPRHHLVLIRTPGERNVLVGISPQNMSLLALDTQPAVAAAAETVETI